MKTGSVKAGLLGAGLVLLTLLSGSCRGALGNAIILCAGDSLTEHGYPSYLQDLLRDEGVKARVLNYGRSGFTSGQYLRFLRDRRGEMSAVHPDFILLQLGTNDVRLDGDRTSAAEFERNMNAILDIFRDFRTRRNRPSRLLLAVIPPIPEGEDYPFSPESSFRVRDEINPALKRLAEERAVPVVDNYSLFLRNPRLLPKVHPTGEGYREMAGNWYQALRPGLPRGRMDRR